MKKNIKTAIILAGGFGTRLQSVVSDVPKPMAQVAGRPFLEYLLDYLIHYGIDEIVLSTGHLSQCVSNHFGETYRGAKIKYAVEDSPLGTGGAILHSMSRTNADNVLVLNGDSFLDVALSDVFDAFNTADFDGAMVLREMQKPDRFGTVEINEKGLVQSFNEKLEGLDRGIINAGIYILSKKLIDQYGLEGKFSIEEDFFKKHISDINILGYVSDGYFIDIGLPDEYERAQSDFKTFRYSAH